MERIILKSLLKKKTLLISLLIIAIFTLVACQNDDAENGEVAEASILGGPLTEFESLDMFGDTVDQSIFADSEVNLVFIWSTG